MPRRRVIALLTVAALALPASALAHIRLQGVFNMTGRITVARDVPGEHVGERVSRLWEFLAPCPAGQCATEDLVRARTVGEDKVSLERKRRVFSRWVGFGSFYAPLQCGAHIYQRGERVWFEIIVQISATETVNGAPIATALRATYSDYRRVNRTKCFAVLGHDAAVYTGTLITPEPVQSGPTAAPG
jgi:hypothetical protein